MKIYVGVVEVLRKKRKGDETQHFYRNKMLALTPKNGTPFEWHKHSGFFKTPLNNKGKKYVG
jgi:hypothetical protein